MKKRSPKILLLADSNAFHTHRFARELYRQGCRVLCASLEPGELIHLKLKRLGPKPFLYYPLASFALRNIIKRFRPDILNAHYATSYGFVAALALKNNGPPLALNLWGSDILIAVQRSWFHRWRTAYALKKSAIVFADSKYLIENALKLSLITNSHVIPWGIEKRYLDTSQENSSKSSKLKIIVPRTHENIYNNEFILKSLAGILKEDKITISFPSFGSQADQFRKLVKELGNTNVTLYEKLPRDKFIPFMAGHDVYLSASGSDSSPVSLIEAMALGLIPVAAKIPGIAEWLNEQNGFLFTFNDAQSLTSAMKNAQAAKATFDQTRNENLKKVREKALFEENVAEHIKLMKEVI